LRNNQKNTIQPDLLQVLQNHCPFGSKSLLQTWLLNRHVIIRISRDRVSKLGDFRAPQNSYPARISINGGLLPIEFLITLAHELAHHDVYKSKGIRQRWGRHKIKPHGIEWKTIFRQYIVEIIESGIVDEELIGALRKCYLEREHIVSTPCIELKRLQEADIGEHVLRVCDLDEGDEFMLRSGRVFKRGSKLRTRYKCRDSNTGKIYTVHGFAPVIKKLI